LGRAHWARCLRSGSPRDGCSFNHLGVLLGRWHTRAQGLTGGAGRECLGPVFPSGPVSAGVSRPKETRYAHDTYRTARRSSPGPCLWPSGYGPWGFLPLYNEAMAYSAAEIVVHRVILFRTPWARGIDLAGRVDLRASVQVSRASLGWAAYGDAYFGSTGDLHLGVNSGPALDAALGYYINPLV